MTSTFDAVAKSVDCCILYSIYQVCLFGQALRVFRDRENSPSGMETMEKKGTFEYSTARKKVLYQKKGSFLQLEKSISFKVLRELPS